MGCDQAASHKAIIQDLINLKDDDCIRTGNAIFINFAGHRSKTKAPVGWHANRNMVQHIVPQDMGTNSISQTTHVIPAQTIAVQLNNLANTKGDNIVRQRAVQGFIEYLA
jgi:hypothetical protein